MSIHIYPPKENITEWVMLLREARYEPISVIIQIHNQLHKAFGAKPNEAVFEGERYLSTEMRSTGLEHRHKDALSDAAGTTVANPVAPSLNEVSIYLHDMNVLSGCVQLFQGINKPGQIFARVDDTALPKNMGKTVLRILNKMMPPGLVLKPPPKKAKEDYVTTVEAYDLSLVSRRWDIANVIPWPVFVNTAPIAVFKEDTGGLEITMQSVLHHEEIVNKEAGTVERYVQGPVLIPDVEDTQKHVYSAEDIRLACHWWAENNRSFSQRHVLQGGEACENNEIVLLENYVMPVDCEINEKPVTKGTWMVGSRINSDSIWDQVVSGKMSTWSMAAVTWSTEEEA